MKHYKLFLIYLFFGGSFFLQDGLAQDFLTIDNVFIANHYSKNYINDVPFGESAYQFNISCSLSNEDPHSIRKATLTYPNTMVKSLSVERFETDLAFDSGIIPISEGGGDPGTYILEVETQDEQVQRIEFYLRETDFIKSWPNVINPTHNSTISNTPIVEWEAFVSDERKITDPTLSEERTSYFVNFYHKDRRKDCWNFNLWEPEANDTYTLAYNEDGNAAPECATLPAGNVAIDFWCYERKDKIIAGKESSITRAVLLHLDVNVQDMTSTDLVKIDTISISTTPIISTQHYTIWLFGNKNTQDALSAVFKTPDGTKYLLSKEEMGENEFGFSSRDFQFPKATGIYALEFSTTGGQKETYELELEDTDFASSEPEILSPRPGETVSFPPTFRFLNHKTEERKILESQNVEEYATYRIELFYNSHNPWNYENTINPNDSSDKMYTIHYNQDDTSTIEHTSVLFGEEIQSFFIWSEIHEMQLNNEIIQYWRTSLQEIFFTIEENTSIESWCLY